MKLGEKRAELVQQFVHDVASEFFTTNTSGPPHWTLNGCFGVFHTIWVHLGPFGCLTKLGAKRAELVQSLCHAVALEFFATKALDPPHWTLNSCFGEFGTIWVHLQPFGCLTKLDANGPNQCKSLCHEVASEFFATNAPDPPH